MRKQKTRSLSGRETPTGLPSAGFSLVIVVSVVFVELCDGEREERES